MQNPLYYVRPFANRFQFAIFLAQQFEQSILFCKEGSLCEVPFPLSLIADIYLFRKLIWYHFEKKLVSWCIWNLHLQMFVVFLVKLSSKAEFERQDLQERIKNKIFCFITLVKRYFCEHQISLILSLWVNIFVNSSMIWYEIAKITGIEFKLIFRN